MENKKGKEACLFYARVSTDHSEQDSSIEAQQKLMQSYMKRHPEKYVEATYIERVSGKSDNRPEYQKMINRVQQGGIDYILIKDFKRISRSTEVSDNLKKLSKHYGFKFILLSTGEVYDPNTNEHRLMFGFEALLNEDMVHRQSEYGRVAHRQKCEAKRLNRNNITFGYTWDEVNKTIIIHDEQAEIIREIFNMYVFKSYGVKEIKKYLYDKGINISQPSINKYLQDETYIGTFHLNKRGSELGVGTGEKTKRFFNDKEDWIPVERPELAIVDTEIFELAQKVRESRTRYYIPDADGKKQGRYSGTHIFSSKVFCAECGYPYTFVYADRNKTIPSYRDSYNQKVVVQKCINTEFYRVREDDLKDITAKAIAGVIHGREHIMDSLMAVIKDVLQRAANDDSELLSLIRKKKQLEAKAEKTKNKYLEASGALSKVLEYEYNDLVNQVSELDDNIKDLQRKKDTVMDIKHKTESRLVAIGKALKEYSSVSAENITREVVQSVIERITISKDGITKVILNGNYITEYKLTPLTRKRRSASFSFSDYRLITDTEIPLDTIERLIAEYFKTKNKSVELPLIGYEVKRTLSGRQRKSNNFMVATQMRIEIQ